MFFMLYSDIKIMQRTTLKFIYFLRIKLLNSGLEDVVSIAGLPPLSLQIHFIEKG